MARSLFSPPEPFSLAPLMALLPSEGSLKALEGLTSSLYARYEKVELLKRETAGVDPASTRRLVAEEAMLKQVLEWLSVQPEKSPPERAEEGE